jgi:hypothetical protein
MWSHFGSADVVNDAPNPGGVGLGTVRIEVQ